MPIKVKIYRRDQPAGVIELGGPAPVLLEGDARLKEVIESVRTGGITQLRDVTDGNERHYYRIQVQPDDPAYPEAFSQWLKVFGYRVRLPEPELDEEISRHLADVPDADLQQRLRAQLPDLTHYEKIVLRDVLRDGKPA